MEYISGLAYASAVIVAVEAFVEECATKLHATDGVADKWMQTGIKCFFIAKMLLENQVFRCEHGFASYIIRIHTLPSPRKGTAVENDHQSIIIRIAQDGFVQTHGFLLVTSEEVYFDSFYSYIMQPFHFLFTDNGIVHVIGRTLYYIIPVAAGTIP